MLIKFKNLIKTLLHSRVANILVDLALMPLRATCPMLLRETYLLALNNAYLHAIKASGADFTSPRCS